MSSTNSEPSRPPRQHADEPHAEGGNAQRLNWLRAGVLGSNDGIVSVAAIVVGVAGATSATGPILAAGLAALVGGAVSMALGEYVSVSSQRDSQQAMIKKEKSELKERPQEESKELSGLYEAQGISRSTADQVAEELTDRDALAAHLSAELGIDEKDVANPWHAAASSALSFTIGGLLPLAAILLPPLGWQIPVTFVVVLLALAITGAIGASIGGARMGRAVIRVVIGGAIALAATFGIGLLLGTSGVA